MSGLMIGGDMVVHYGGSIRYFLDAVIKHHDQKRLWRKERVYTSRGRAHNLGRGMTTGGWSRKLRDHVFKHTQEAERVN